MAHVQRASQTVDESAETTSSVGDRRTRLLEAGEKIFSERPFAEVSAQDIADRAGVAHGLLFHYFGSKREFYFAVLERTSERTLELWATNTASDPKRWLRKEMDTFLVGIAETAAMFSALIHGSLGAETEVKRVLDRQRDAGVRRLLAKLAPASTSDLLIAALRAWIISANELGALWLESGRAIPRTHVRSIIIATLNASLRAVAEVDRKGEFDPDTFVGA